MTARLPIRDLPALLKRGGVRPLSNRVARRAMRRPEWNGIVFRSKTECAYAQRLDAERMLGLIVAWRYEPHRLDIGAGRKYRIDFEIIPHEGKPILVEVKGFKRAGDRRVYRDSNTRTRFAQARERHSDRYEFRYVRAVGGGQFEEVRVR